MNDIVLPYFLQLGLQLNVRHLDIYFVDDQPQLNDVRGEVLPDFLFAPESFHRPQKSGMVALPREHFV